MSLPATRKKPGRPSSFTPATVNKILRSVARGMPLVHAASVGGISFQTLSTHRSQHPDFAAALAQAVAKGIEARLKVVERAMDSPDEAIRLRAACWYLEHTAPEHFAKNRLEITGADGSPAGRRRGGVSAAKGHRRKRQAGRHRGHREGD